MNFFIYEFKIYRVEQPSRFHLFKPNEAAQPYKERWVHIKINHPNPDALVKARPDRIEAAHLSLPTSGGQWVYIDDGVWIFRGAPVAESCIAQFSLAHWTEGRYVGESFGGYRNVK